MRVERRTLHPEQRSSNWQLLNHQRRLLSDLFYDDLEIYDDDGELIAITSRDNPNLDRVLETLGHANPRPDTE